MCYKANTFTAIPENISELRLQYSSHEFKLNHINKNYEQQNAKEKYASMHFQHIGIISFLTREPC